MLRNMFFALGKQRQAVNFFTKSANNLNRFSNSTQLIQHVARDYSEKSVTKVAQAQQLGYVRPVDPVTNAEIKPFKLTRKLRKQAKDELAIAKNTEVQDIKLNNLAPLPGAKRYNIKRLGRGRSSGRGRFSTRGNHGQHARTSVNVPVLFEGGSKPLYIRVPKHGFNNRNFSLRYASVSLGQIQLYIDSKRIDPSSGTITIKTLHDCGLLKGVKWPGFKLLSTGKEYFTAKVDIEAQRASKLAIEAVEKNGGSIRSVYFNRRGLHSILHPEKYDVLNVQRVYAMPPPKLFKYYMRSDIRGYLADTNPVSMARDVVPDSEAKATRASQEKILQNYLKDQKGKGGKKSKK